MDKEHKPVKSGLAGKTLYHYTERKNIPSVLQYGLIPEKGSHSEEIQLLSKYLKDKPVAESIYLFDEYRGTEIAMGDRILDACIAVDPSFLSGEYLYAANLELSDLAIESCINLEDCADMLDHETENENMEDILAYANSILPYEEYVALQLDYGENLELLYTKVIPPQAIKLIE